MSTQVNDNTDVMASQSAFWIFGYSSLCWNPGFSYRQSCIGYVNGYSRKFWQGSTSHRGTKSQPGRVATLVEDDSSIVWGCAFKITPESSAFRYLQTRECSNGGYRPETVLFYPHGDQSEAPIQALTFVAHSDNCWWLGDAPLIEIASQIVDSEGAAGHNAEYLLKLASYMRNHVPQERDRELFELEKLVMEHIEVRNLKLCEMLMGCVAGMELEERIEKQSRNEPGSREPMSSTNNDFTHRVPDKKLRCVNI